MLFLSSSSQVPTFQTYFPSHEVMNRKQQRFYKKFKKGVSKGQAVNVDGNISYIFLYMYELLSLHESRLTISNLNNIKKLYPEYEKLTSYCDIWISDCYVLEGDIFKAIDTFPKLSPASRSSSSTDSLLSLKLHVGKEISGIDILTLFGPKVTKFAKDNLFNILEHIDIQIAAIKDQKGINLLQEWAKETYKVKAGYSIFSGSIFSDYIADIPSYCFSLNKNIEKFVIEVTREAENTYREEAGIPKIGEGWISETKLYYEIKKAFPDFTVTHHARPSYLGRQHLDILIEEPKIAIEYQGLQHDQPVEFFGGKEAFLKSQKRDARKRRLCKKNDIILLYVREGYSIDEIIYKIKKSLRIS